MGNETAELDEQYWIDVWTVCIHPKPSATNDNVFETIKKLSELKDIGVITQEEFDAKKAELLAKL